MVFYELMVVKVFAHEHTVALIGAYFSCIMHTDWCNVVKAKSEKGSASLLVTAGVVLVVVSFANKSIYMCICIRIYTCTRIRML